MKDLLDLHGIVTVLNTPFTEDDRIDIDGLRAHVRYALDAGVGGFLVPAMASEVGKLSEQERDFMVEAVIDETAGRVPVIGGASAESDDERIRICRRLIEAGCQGVLVSLPFRGESEYEAQLRRLADLDPPFLMVQDWDPAGPGVPVPVICRLFDAIDAFRALKVEVTPAGPKYTEVLRATGGRLNVSGGWAVGQMIEGLDRGVHAFMPTGLHHCYSRVYRLYRSGNREAARAWFERMLPILAFSNQHLDISIHFFKRLLCAQGIYRTARVREPILGFDATHERLAASLIERAIALEEQAVSLRQSDRK